MSTIITILLLLIVFSLLVFVHELGHFLAAKLTKVPVEEFALGFGPKLWSKEFKGTLYRFNLIPLGGYVKLFGEEDRNLPSQNAFGNKRFREKFVVLIAGVFMNVLLAIALFAIYLPISNYRTQIVKIADFEFRGAVTNSYFPIIITRVEQGSPADGKLSTDEAIIGLSGERIKDYEQFKSILAKNAGKSIPVEVINLKNSEISKVEVKLRTGTDGLLGIGVSLSQYPFYDIAYPNSITSAIWHTYNMAAYQVPAIGELISKSVRESDPSYAAQSVSGIIGVSAVVGELVAAEQFWQIVNLAALISLSLALVNLLPLPILDGGQILIAFIERIRRKKLGERTIGIVNSVSLVFIVALTIVISLKDLWQFNALGNIMESVRKVLGI